MLGLEHGGVCVFVFAIIKILFTTFVVRILILFWMFHRKRISYTNIHVCNICEVSGFFTLDCWWKRVNIIEQKVHVRIHMPSTKNRGKGAIFQSV